MGVSTIDIPAPTPVACARAEVEVVGGERCADARRREWAALAARTPGATMFQDPLWSDVVERVFGHRPRHLLALQRGRVVGILPLMEVQSLFAGRMLVSVPYATGGGSLAESDEISQTLADAAARLCRTHGARVVDVRSSCARFRGWLDDDRYVGFARDFPHRATEIETFFPRKARAAARQAQARERLTVRHETGDLPAVWNLYSRSMRRLGSISYPWRFFEGLQAAYGRRMWITSVWDSVRPVTGVVSFVDRDTIRPYFAGADESRRLTGCTNLMYRELARRAVAEGLRRFDFGRTRRRNVGALDFKRNQGFEPEPLGYQRFVPPGRAVPDLTPGNTRFALAQRVWPLLPLSLTRALGGWLSRSIPG